MHGKNINTLLTKLRYCLVFAIALSGAAAAYADFRDDVDFTKLRNEYGSNLPNGQGIRIAQIEFVRDGAWAPTAQGDLAGKNFTYASSFNGANSGHGYEVGVYLGGNNSSMTPGLEGWTAYEAWNYIGRGSLNGNRYLEPLPASWDIENHSWGGNDALYAPVILAKMDYRIQRDNVIACVGVDNGGSLSNLLANGYNSIAVGSSTGNHPQSGSNVDGSGRCKPDLVGTATYTSYATPIVASSAAILVGETKRNPSLGEARSPLAIKALLMAGATKGEFGDWSNSPSQPLHRTWGAGEVNIYNSYKALVAGRKYPSSASYVGPDGWDVNTVSNGSRRYFISVPNGQTLTLSAVLTWYRHIQPDSTWGNYTPRMSNLRLTLWRTDGSLNPTSEVTYSDSHIDNVEHVYQRDLPSGNYALEVTGSDGGEKYGLAWKGQLDGTATGGSPSTPPPAPTPEPTPTPTPEPQPTPQPQPQPEPTPQPTPAPTTPEFVSNSSTADIGTVGAGGSFSYNSGNSTLTITSTGVDLIGARDGCYVMTKSTWGDFEISTRIHSLNAANVSAKAGLTIRESTAANSMAASVVVTAGGNVCFLRRTRTGSFATVTTVLQVSAPVNLKLRRVGGVVTAYYSRDGGSTWASLGIGEVAFGQNVQAGLVATSKDTNAPVTAQVDVPTLTTGISQNAFGNLNLFDIGTVNVAATGGFDGGSSVYTLNATGVFAGKNREGIAFLGRRSNGDGAISTMVESNTSGPGALRAGLMIRDALADNAPQVTLGIIESTGLVAFEYRTTYGGYVATHYAHTSGRYLILDRRGNVFTALVSSDGVNWSTIGTATVVMRSDAQIGLVGISKSLTESTSIRFSGFDVVP